MKKSLLDPGIPFFKANLHSHTTESDGTMSPVECAQAYRKQGYGILALTDHNKYHFHADLNSEDFVCLAACEEDVYQHSSKNEVASHKGKCYHFNVYDLAPFFRPVGYKPPHVPQDYSDVAAINAWIRQLNADDYLVCLNHPSWSMQDVRDYVPLEGFWSMEIFNYASHLEGMYGATPQVYDEVLREGKRIFCLATDDNHNKSSLESQHSNSFGGFTMFNIPALNYENVVKAMRNGNFYASSGPLIQELSIDTNILRIVTSPVTKIYVITGTRKCFRKIANPGSYITQADFNISKAEDYVRVQIEDATGKYAWTRAYFRDELCL